MDVGVSFHSFNGTGEILLDFPHFNSTFNYDPDFSVTLGSEGDGGSGDLKLLALLSLLLIPAVFILAAVVVGTIICIYNRRRINRSQAINYVSNDGKEDYELQMCSSEFLQGRGNRLFFIWFGTQISWLWSRRVTPCNVACGHKSTAITQSALETLVGTLTG